MSNKVELSYDEFIEKYGDIIVKFHHYYKFYFYFSATIDGKTYNCKCGGIAQDIYKIYLVNDEHFPIRGLEDLVYAEVLVGEEPSLLIEVYNVQH